MCVGVVLQTYPTFRMHVIESKASPVNLIIRHKITLSRSGCQRTNNLGSCVSVQAELLRVNTLLRELSVYLTPGVHHRRDEVLLLM